MKVLITGGRLDLRAGTEMFLRDLARGLQGLGHTVMAYSANPEHRERLLENDVIPVATDLENLPVRPDVIHAQRHVSAMTAISALPGVPAIYHGDGAIRTERPPKHPRIYHYLAMSPPHAELMAVEQNIAPADIEVFLNGVDLGRFGTVRKLPVQPRRALFLNRRHDADGETVGAICEAASRCGMALDFISQLSGSTIDQPEKGLPEYDLVFASGRSAIEALASGCAVVVLGRTSCGALVTPENFDRFRQVDFSMPSDSPPPTPEKITQEIQRYAADPCALVTARVREEADFAPSVRRLVTIYEQVIALHQKTKPDLQEEILATSRYLKNLVPFIMATDAMLGRNWMSETRATDFDDLNTRLSLIEERLKAQPGKPEDNSS